jgi:hypothetical protein
VSRTKNNPLDIIAMTSSLVCAIHCAFLPILLSFSSFSSLYFLNNPMIEWTFICLGLVFIFTSLWPSYKNTHHKTKPLKVALLGFLLLAISRLHLTDLWEVSNTAIGATLIAFAHYINWNLLRRIAKQKQ